MKMAGIGFWLLAWAACTSVFANELEPETFWVQTGARFQAAGPDAPAWVGSLQRREALQAETGEAWTYYDVLFAHGIHPDHLAVELLLQNPLPGLMVHLLDAAGNVVKENALAPSGAEASSGRLLLNIPLTPQPDVAGIQICLPVAQEAFLQTIALTPATYEALMKTTLDNQASPAVIVGTPNLLDSKNAALAIEKAGSQEGRYQAEHSGPIIMEGRAYGVASLRIAFEPAAQAGGAGAPAVMEGVCLVESLPELARLDVMVRNLDPVTPLEVHVNGQFAGRLMPVLPDLEDPAYALAPGNAFLVTARVPASLLFAPEFLRTGQNTIQIRQAAAGAARLPLEISEGRIQLKYPWDQLDYFDLRMNARMEEPPANAASDLQPDAWVMRLGRGFRAITPANANKPAWLRAARAETTRDASNRVQNVRYVFELEPGHTPLHLGLDLVFYGGNTPAGISLLDANGNPLQSDLFGTIAQGSGYGSALLDIPLLEYPKAAAIVLNLGPRTAAAWSRLPYIYRVTFKPAAIAVVARTGDGQKQTSPAPFLYDTKSGFIPAEILAAYPAPAGGAAAVPLKLSAGPLLEDGRWYGVETRVLDRKFHQMGDPKDVFFVTQAFELQEIPLLCRVDFLVDHLNVVEGVEVYINDQLMGRAMLQLPDLEDANYMIFRVNPLNADGTQRSTRETLAIDYGPWARGWLVFPAAALRTGTNHLRIGKPGRLAGTNDDYGLKDLRIQFKYAWEKLPRLE